MKTNLSITLTTVAIVLMLSLVVQIILVAPAHALTRYYNCIARVANKNATLSISNVDACYNMIFKGALNYYGIKQNPNHQNGTDTSPTDSGKKFDKDSGYNAVNNNEKKSASTHVSSNNQDVFG